MLFTEGWVVELRASPPTHPRIHPWSLLMTRQTPAMRGEAVCQQYARLFQSDEALKPVLYVEKVGRGPFPLSSPPPLP
jgi:hypothetical protein